jgi:ornithine carbamoyltransferase
MSFNLRNRSFLKELDFEPRELKFLLELSTKSGLPSTPATSGLVSTANRWR